MMRTRTKMCQDTFFYLTAGIQKAGKTYRQYSGNRGIIPSFISYLVQKEIPAAG